MGAYLRQVGAGQFTRADAVGLATRTGQGGGLVGGDLLFEFGRGPDGSHANRDSRFAWRMTELWGREVQMLWQQVPDTVSARYILPRIN